MVTSTHAQTGSEAAPVLRMDGVRKAYHALRPLRIDALSVEPGGRVSLAGVDAAGAELLVNLVTGAALPDAGHVWTFGRRTDQIASGDEWLAWLDNFGIVSERGVLLEESTLEQNLAMPFTLQIDPVPAEIAARVADLARECGLFQDLLPVRVADLPADARLRVHLARSVALEPRLLIIEHPTARIADSDRTRLADDVARVCARRGLAALIVTNDAAFARAAAPTNLAVDPATGSVRPLKKGWFR